MVRGNGDGWACSRVSSSRVSQRDGIEPSLREWMAARKPPQRKPRALENSESNQRNVGILRAGRQIKTLRRAEGMKHLRQNERVQTIDAADREAGLGVWHRVRRQEVAYRFASAFPQPSGSRERHWQLHAQARQTQDR